MKFDIRITSGERVLVDVRDFTIQRGKVTFLFGESGIGKSLTARAVYGLVDPLLFDVRVNGEAYESYLRREETVTMRRNGFFVFQEPSSHLNPLMSLGSQLREGSLADAPDEAPLLRELWDTPETGHLEKLLSVYPRPHRPSGGEKQRMLLVMALKKLDAVLGKGIPDDDLFFFFDEPTGSLDNHFRDIFVNLLFRRFERHPFTTLLITHDYSMISLVTESHRNVSARVAFRELSLANERLEVRDFQPSVYLGWLKGRRRVHGRSTREKAPVLEVGSSMSVFGSELRFSRDPGGKETCPLVVFPGGLTYLKARSGVGKTTVLKTAMGLTAARRFNVRLNGIGLTETTPKWYWRREVWGKGMTMVFQHADEALNPNARVKEVFNGLPIRGIAGREGIMSRLLELFDGEVDEEFLNKQISGLSGGQKQRLNLARALSLDTSVILLDEPLNGLDFATMHVVLGLLEQKREEGKGILLVTHNEEIVSTLVASEDVYYLHSSGVPPGGETT